MGFSSSIQFRTPEQVIEAFTARNVEAWSISAGKQFMFKGIGLDEFQNVIVTIDQGDSNATYTVQVYEDIEDAKQIKNTTPNDGSFNFKLNDGLHNLYNQLKPAVGRLGSNEMISKLNAMEQRLNDMDAPPDDDDGLGVVGRLLKHPALAGVAPMIVTKVFELLTGGQAVGNTNGQTHETKQIDHAGVDQVFTKLKNYDPQLQKHLSKLVSIAETDPATFQTILTALDQ